MAIEIGCTGCGQTLRVADEHAGKKARCPACGTIVQVPEAGMAAPLEPLAESPFSGKPPLAPDANPFGDRPEPPLNPYARPGTSPFQPPQSYLRPHRGGLILAFGLLGVLCCLPFAIVAWVMGAADLKEIRAGRMDPSGQGMTQAGMIIGIVGTVLAGIWIVINIVIVAANAL
jgi:ribosomal protein S27E